MMNSYKDRDGTEWASAFGGLYFGKQSDGVVRVAITNGLPPWDEKAETRQGNTLQPEHFAKVVEFLIGRTLADHGKKVVALTDTAAALGLSGVLAFFRPGGTPPSKEQLEAIEAIPPLLGELAWAKDVIALTMGYSGPLAYGSCPLDTWLLAAAAQLRGLDKPRGEG